MRTFLAALLGALVFCSSAPALPTNTELPKLSGEAKVGATLTTTHGKWSPEGTVFGYSWERCNTSGAECVYEGEGFNSSTYLLREVDSGHTVKSLVADICGGFCFVFAQSAPSATVEAEKRTTNCVGHEVECGFPSKTSVGVESGQTLTESSPLTITKAGTAEAPEVIHNLRFHGTAEGTYLTIDASHVHIKNVELTVANLPKIDCTETTKPTSGSGAIKVSNSVKHLEDVVIEHVTINAPENASECPTSGEDLLGGIAIDNTNVSNELANVKVLYSSIYNHSMCWRNGLTVEHSYCDVNANYVYNHYDGLYLGSGSAKVVGNTIIVPHKQTSPLAVFADFGTIETLTVEGNLLAGGGWTMYGGAKSCPKQVEEGKGCVSGTLKEGKQVVGPITVKNNKIARCAGAPVSENNGHSCEGFPAVSDANEQPLDGDGFFPEGGFFPGTWADFVPGTFEEGGNVFDDNNAAAPAL